MSFGKQGRQRHHSVNWVAKRAAFCAIALTAGCLISLMLAEIGLRVSNVWIGRHSDTMFTLIEYDGVLGWKMKPSVNGKVDLVDVENIPVRSNSAGFWDDEFMRQKQLHSTRIAFLGDSFTWGMGVREEERFSNLFMAANPEWESLNFGIPGYGTDQSLLVWQHIARRYQPDVVVLTVNQNDYLDNMYLVRYGRRKPYFELKGETLELRNVPVDPTDFWDNGIFNQAAPPYVSFFPDPVQKRSRIVHWLAKNSDLARLFYTVIRANRTRPFPEADEGGSKSLYEKPQDPDRAVSGKTEVTPLQQMQVKLLDGLVTRLAERVQLTGARFAVVFSGKMVPQYELQKKMFSEAGVLYIDATTEVLANRLPPGRKDVYYPYSGHWTPAAHRAVADLIAKAIREMRLCVRAREH